VGVPDRPLPETEGPVRCHIPGALQSCGQRSPSPLRDEHGTACQRDDAEKEKVKSVHGLDAWLLRTPPSFSLRWRLRVCRPMSTAIGEVNRQDYERA